MPLHPWPRKGESYADEFAPSDMSAPGQPKKYAFSQWFFSQAGGSSDTMGYTVKSGDNFRLTEYVPYDLKTHRGNWARVLAGELYDYNVDPAEVHNHINNASYASVVAELHQALVAQFAS